MKQYDAASLVVHPTPSSPDGLIVQVTPALAGWETISFQVRSLEPGQTFTHYTAENEAVIVLLSGTLAVECAQNGSYRLGPRSGVFHSLPHTLYLPRSTRFTIRAESSSEFALAEAPAKHSFPARVIPPEEVAVEIRGGDHATRQIHRILPPGSPCDRLVVVEVLTPSGNWSSYPPHKHDARKVDEAGRVIEADLDEIYYYKIDPPGGYAIQRVYTGADSPLQQAGKGFDAALIVQHNDVVLVPEGYHPVSSPPGYTSYYLNILAGSDQSLAALDDPAFTWVKETYTSRDPRVPLFPVQKISE
jgi:5-deoxy-glucuronate isomerase